MTNLKSRLPIVLISKLVRDAISKFISNKSFKTLFAIALVGSIIFLHGCGSNKKLPPVMQIPEQLPKPQAINNVKVALVLGSGGIRGMAHLGVLEVLEEYKVPVDLIVGSSAGAIVGALYANNPKAAQIKNQLLSINKSEVINVTWASVFKSMFCPVGPFQDRQFVSFLYKYLGDTRFPDLKIPLVVSTTNIKNNTQELMYSGPIVPAVHASSAMPPFFSPVNIYDGSYVDGGVYAPVPVEAAQYFNPKVIIAVDISAPPSTKKIKNMFDLTLRALDISFYKLSKLQSNEAQIVIHPKLPGYATFDDAYAKDIYLAGRQAALDQIENILNIIKNIK